MGSGVITPGIGARTAYAALGLGTAVTLWVDEDAAAPVTEEQVVRLLLRLHALAELDEDRDGPAWVLGNV